MPNIPSPAKNNTILAQVSLRMGRILSPLGDHVAPAEYRFPQAGAFYHEARLKNKHTV
jgi:hypothetical protein